MSLMAIFDKQKTQSIKEVMPQLLPVYKVAVLVYDRDSGRQPKFHYVAPFRSYQYKAGQQYMQTNHSCLSARVVDSPTKKLSYYPGFHSLVKKSAAEKYLGSSGGFSARYPSRKPVLLTCEIEKDWIIAIGIEGNRNMVVVSDRIVMPAYPSIDVDDMRDDSYYQSSLYPNQPGGLLVAVR